MYIVKTSSQSDFFLMYTCLCLDHVPTVFPIIEEYSASEIQAVLAERRVPSFLSSWILLEMQIIKIKVHLFFILIQIIQIKVHLSSILIQIIQIKVGLSSIIQIKVSLLSTLIQIIHI